MKSEQSVEQMGALPGSRTACGSPNWKPKLTKREEKIDLDFGTVFGRTFLVLG
jgi:hypothetical protein